MLALLVTTVMLEFLTVAVHAEHFHQEEEKRSPHSTVKEPFVFLGDEALSLTEYLYETVPTSSIARKKVTTLITDSLEVGW
jgi:hypothetical protein